MITLKLVYTLMEETLGTLPGDPETYEKFIAKNMPGADEAEKAAKLKEELEALPEFDEELEKGSTLFARFDEEKKIPMLWDYQVKGFFKEATLALHDITGSLLDTKEKQKKLKLTQWTYKRTIDNLLFVNPRKIKLELPEGGEMGWCQRPLLAETQKGKRVALANSETVPAGTTLTVELEILNDKLQDVFEQAMLYGSKKGLGQWRNSGKGRFDFEIIDEVKSEPEFLDLKLVKRRKKDKKEAACA